MIAALLLAAMAPAATPPVAGSPPPAASTSANHATHYYPPAADATALVEAALAEAAGGGRRAVLVFGADWCHDSQALAAVLSSETFSAEFGDRYRVVFIDVDHPKADHGRNQELIARFGVKKMMGTPEMLVIGADGKPLNSIKDAQSWHNAGNRSVNAILGWFGALPPAPKPAR